MAAILIAFYGVQRPLAAHERRSRGSVIAVLTLGGASQTRLLYPNLHTVHVREMHPEFVRPPADIHPRNRMKVCYGFAEKQEFVRSGRVTMG